MLLSFVRYMFPYFTGEYQASRLVVFAALGAMDQPLASCMLVHFLEIRRTRTYLSDATAVPVVTSNGDESEFFITYIFLFNSSRNYSMNWRYILMKLQQHPVYYCFVNNTLKHEGDILHICDDIVNVIFCFRRINNGFPVAYFYFIC